MSSFPSFFAALTQAFPKDHARGKQFERVCKWFLETDPRFSGRLDRVWLWDNWPGKWGPDCGIDLVARDGEGKTWAIQAKCYAADHSITKHDMDKFLSESVNEAIDCRLLIATTDRMAANAERGMLSERALIFLCSSPFITEFPLEHVDDGPCIAPVQIGVS